MCAGPNPILGGLEMGGWLLASPSETRALALSKVVLVVGLNGESQVYTGRKNTQTTGSRTLATKLSASEKEEVLLSPLHHFWGGDGKDKVADQ